MAYNLRYCVVHDSLWLDSMGDSPICESRALYLEQLDIAPGDSRDESKECEFIDLEGYRRGSKRL